MLFCSIRCARFGGVWLGVKDLSRLLSVPTRHTRDCAMNDWRALIEPFLRIWCSKSEFRSTCPGFFADGCAVGDRTLAHSPRLPGRSRVRLLLVMGVIDRRVRIGWMIRRTMGLDKLRADVSNHIIAITTTLLCFAPPKDFENSMYTYCFLFCYRISPLCSGNVTKCVNLKLRRR